MNNDIQLAARSDEWLEVGLSCEPTDRAGAEQGVLLAYENAGLPAPKSVLWAGSPLEAAKIVASLDDPGASVRPKVRTGPWAVARQELMDRLGPGFARHWIATTRRPWRQLVDQIATPMRQRLNAHFAAQGGQEAELCRHALLDAILGQHDAAWLAAFAGSEADGLAGLARVARNAGWWWAFERVAVISERHIEVHRDNLGRLHQGDGPALSYPDGYGIHAWRGMPIPPEVVAELATLTVQRIQAESNAEMRRVMLEHYGFERYLRESGAKKQHTDDFGTLWRVDIPGDEELVMVEVINSTAEPDGTFRTYFLRVPPQTDTARAGVAWTFGLSEQEYAPTKQT